MTNITTPADENLSNLELSLDKYFTQLGSSKRTCVKCNREYYTFQKEDFCGSSKCLTPIPFIEKLNSKPNRTSHIYLGERFSDFFSKQGYNIIQSENINNSATTLFIGAGIQTTEIILERGVIPTNPICLVQPCVRVHAIGSDKTLKGYSSGFHVATTQRVNATIDEFVKDIDTWLKYLADIKFPYSHMNFFFGTDWTGGKMKGVYIAAYLGKTQLCDFVYVNKMPDEAKIKTISDMSLGLERLSWMKIKTESYFQAFCPIIYLRDFTDVQLDILRTLTLLASSGVVPSNKSRGYKVEEGVVTTKRGSGQVLKQLAQLYSNEKGSNRINDLVQTFYEEWSNFGKISISLADTQKIIQSEINKAYNLQTIKKFKFDPKKFQTELELDAFIDQIIQKTQIPFNEIVRVLKNDNLLR